MANAFRHALVSGRAQIGLWLGLADPYCAEICAGAGFDWLLIDGEHAPNDLRSMLAQLQAIAPYGSQPVVRPVVGETHRIKQLLDIGAQTILVPMVETADQARGLVAAMHYPPRGVRGVGTSLARASRWNLIPDYAARCGDELCLLVQIESRRGLQNIEEIANVDGVDGVFIGPADLSAALGHLGDPGAPAVQEAINAALDAIARAKKASGILMSDPTLAQQYLDRGCGFVAVGVDTSLLAQATRDLAQRYGRAKSSAPSPSGPTIY